MFIFNKYVLFILMTTVSLDVISQPTFTRSTDILPFKSLSNITLATVDINKDLKDDIVYLERGTQLHLLIQPNSPKPFNILATKKADDLPQWSMLTADVDKDGKQEFFPAGNYDNIKYITLNASNNLIEKLSFGSDFYAQGSNLIDFNNDGYLDLFFCNDDGPNRIFIFNPATKLFKEEFPIDFTTNPSSDMSGNYNSEWLDVDNDGDLDLFIAKCRGGVSDPNSPLRLNQLYINNNGVFQNEAQERGMADGAQTWIGAWADVDNDGDLDCYVLNHYESAKLMINDGFGYFTTKLLNFSHFGFQAVWKDIDNDGFQDIIIAGDKDYILMNKGDYDFEIIENFIGPARANSLTLGDYNDDGFIDIFYSYGKEIVKAGNKHDDIWINDGNENKWLKLNLLGSTSNAEGIGAKITIYYGDKIQYRVVKGGEGYGITNSYQQHFGLEQEEAIDSMIIKWPSGLIDTYYDVESNQKYFAQEGKCMTPRITEDENKYTLCQGVAITVQAKEGFDTYLWSNGSTERTMEINTIGEFTYRAFDANGCVYQSDGISVNEEPKYLGLEEINSNYYCEDNNYILKASAGYQYDWQDGSNDSFLIISSPGIYKLNATSYCGEIISDSISVQSLSDIDYNVNNDTIIKFESGMLNSNGYPISWYENMQSNYPLSNNEIFSIDNVESNTDIYYEILNYEGDDIVGFSPIDFDQSNLFGSTNVNGGLYFETDEDVVIEELKVFSKIVGDRRIIILDHNANNIYSKDFNVGEGEQTLNLNAFIPAGSSYLITTDESFNLSSLGTISPQFARLNNGVTYDILKDNCPLTISTSNKGDNAYYYFYDWTIIDNVSVCKSGRKKASIILDTSSSIDFNLATSTYILPNPIRNFISIDSPAQFENFSIFNTNGKLIIRGNVNNNHIENLNYLPEGNYVLQLFDDKRTPYIFRFIKS